MIGVSTDNELFKLGIPHLPFSFFAFIHFIIDVLADIDK
jgi:hypothetical protein